MGRRSRPLVPPFRPNQDDTVRFAICNETFEDWPWQRICANVQALGYGGLEVAPFTLGDDLQTLGDGARAALRRTAGEFGLEIVGLHWLFARTQGCHLTNPDPRVRRHTSDHLKRLVDLCQDLAGRVMVLGSPQHRRLAEGVSRGDGLAYAAEVIQSAVPLLTQAGVVLAIEPLGARECNLLRSAAEAEELIRIVDSPSVRLHLDVKAMSQESMPVPDIIREHAAMLAHFHANDPNLRGPGMGHVDFVPILQALRDVGYTGWVSVEVFDMSPGPEQLASQSIEYLRACWQQVQA